MKNIHEEHLSNKDKARQEKNRIRRKQKMTKENMFALLIYKRFWTPLVQKLEHYTTKVYNLTV
jgi:hypothetical protein